MNSSLNIIKEFANGIEILSKKSKDWAKTIDWEAIIDNFEYIQNQLPKDLENLSIDLTNKGWFIWLFNDSLPNLVDTLKYLLNENEKNQNIKLTSYFDSQLGIIEKELISNYPNRINQIEDAFSTHKHKLYFSSTPALLILAEDICREMYPQIGLYAKCHYKPKTIDIFDKVPHLEIYEEAILKPLQMSSRVTETIKNSYI
jgi:hypothetical protein